MNMQIHSLPAGDVLKHRHKAREIEVSPVTAVNKAELVRSYAAIRHITCKSYFRNTAI